MLKTIPEEFIKFHNLLMSNAPQGYIPWHFPVVANNKSPDHLAVLKRCKTKIETKYSWKEKHARLSFEEAVERLKQGENVGISARKGDPLVIIDIDNPKFVDKMPDTLIVRSRKRVGFHGFCWADNFEKLNIPTADGEIRAVDQYVVACGSYCTTSENDINEEDIPEEEKKAILNDKYLGNYTLFKAKEPKLIKFTEIPDFFLERYNLVKEEEQTKPELKSNTIPLNSKHSALFDLKITDIVSTLPNRREPHPLHSSDTGMNFSVNGDLAHCWRHCVSLNALQFMVVKSGYMSCEDAGTGHKGSGAGSSRVSGDDGAIFYAWLEAKKSSLIPLDDPVPLRAMLYIAKLKKLIPNNFDDLLPIDIYDKVIDIINQEYSWL
jgi:putative DNA primase/helicase